MYLTLKNTEFWLKKRGHGHRSKEKHFEFAKDLFKIWDADGGGFLDVDEISLPLIALGLSTDTGFVEKLIKSLKKKKAPKEGDDEDDLSFTLKDFVSIFKADRIGERISKKVKE
jgi:Ca2+-binding EF-hand superfamily protein